MLNFHIDLLKESIEIYLIIEKYKLYIFMDESSNVQRDVNLQHRILLQLTMSDTFCYHNF